MKKTTITFRWIVYIIIKITKSIITNTSHTTQPQVIMHKKTTYNNRRRPRKVNSEITLTYHARERLNQRSCETLESLSELIRSEKYLKIGWESGSNREHLLFFSTLDAIWHVLIIDVKTKEIITILPVDFHENVSWKISDETLEDARHLAICSHASAKKHKTS